MVDRRVAVEGAKELAQAQEDIVEGLGAIADEWLKEFHKTKDFIKVENEWRKLNLAKKGRKPDPLYADSRGRIVWDFSVLLDTLTRANRWDAFVESRRQHGLNVANKQEIYLDIRTLVHLRDKSLGHRTLGEFTSDDNKEFFRKGERVLRSLGADVEAAKLRAAGQSIADMGGVRTRDVFSGAESLIEKAVSSPAIRLLREDFRGLELDEPASIERISPGERIRIEIDLNKLAIGDLRYGLVLVADPTEVVCLLPSARIAPSRELRSRNVKIPDPSTTSRPLRFQGTLGRHVILALFTRTMLPEKLYAALAAPQPRGFLSNIADAISNLKQLDWHLIKLEFDVG